jgi:hypothetical protein
MFIKRKTFSDNMGYDLLWLGIYGFLGLIVGYILSKISPEEMKSGKKHFMNGKGILAWLIVLAFFFFSWKVLNVYYIFLILLGLLLGIFFRGIYFIFGVGLAFASGGFSYLLASLIFIFGMFEGSLNSKWHAFWIHFISYFIPIIVVLIYNFSSVINGWHVLSVVSGYLIAYGYKKIRRI